ATVALTHVMELGGQIELARVLRVRAVDQEAESLHPPSCGAVEQHGPHGLAVHRSHLLALAQIGDRCVPILAARAVSNAAAGAATVEPEHETRPLRRAAMDRGEHAQR